MSRAIVLVLLAGLAAAGCMDRKTGGGGAVATTAPGKKVYTREEFKTAVMGKTPDEVQALLGRPEHTQEVAGEPRWTYLKVTTDPVSGKIDTATYIQFEGGKVANVYF